MEATLSLRRLQRRRSREDFYDRIGNRVGQLVSFFSGRTSTANKYLSGQVSLSDMVMPDMVIPQMRMYATIPEARLDFCRSVLRSAAVDSLSVRTTNVTGRSYAQQANRHFISEISCPNLPRPESLLAERTEDKHCCTTMIRQSSNLQLECLRTHITRQCPLVNKSRRASSGRKQQKNRTLGREKRRRTSRLQIHVL